ncbi:HtaA domain-containing protein, partial [Streptomyces sp. G1]|uniref:HtaA domain-containing protein n=1 Tax=Streptomyces sp. G1 TaxID=361572 RepID=UPI00202F83C9
GGTLYADVRSPDFSGEKVPLVTFPAKKLKAGKGLVRLTEAPAKLTARGAEAFGGMYQAGAEMDPVSLAVATTASAELPALPDLGSDIEASESPTPSASPEPSTEPVASATDDDEGGASAALPLGLTAGGLALVAAATALIVRRRRAN